MASVKHLGGNKYKVTISAGFDAANHRKRIYKTIEAKSEAAAQKAANALEAEVLKGEYVEPTRLSFADYVEKWKKDAERKLAPKTYLRYCELLTSRIIPEIGHIKLEKLNPILIEDFYNKLREPQKRVRKKKDGTKKVTTYTLSEQTIKHHHRLISAIMQTAFKKGLIKENPCVRVDAPKINKKELAIYNEEQISALIKALEPAELKYKACIHIALAGGLRLGEVLGLEWEDVDFAIGTITIRRTSQYLPKKGVFTKAPKNETSKRTISLPLTVMNLIAQLQEEQTAWAKKLANKWEESNRLFTTATGGPMHTYSPSKWFNAFLKANNLPPLRFHGLRHTSASYLIAAGQDVVTVAKRLGHSNSNTTLSIYAHSFKKRDEEAANRMDGLYVAKTEETKSEDEPKGKARLRLVK